MVSEPIAGLARARNCGIAATRAPLIADIDDDATANPDWLECFLARFKELPDKIGVVGGEINPVWQTMPPEWLTPAMKGILSASTNLGDVPGILKPYEGLIECNICYRREALASVGYFPVELGRVGDLLLSGEGAIDTVMRSKGWLFFFEPAAIVNHTIHADRLTPKWLRKRMFWQGVTDYAMYLYYQRCGLETIKKLDLDLPAASDWVFINNDSAENLSSDMKKLEALGFVLAMYGIIPTGTK
jgi:glycosyltransferase involved in cell wall biosynthesis